MAFTIAPHKGRWAVLQDGVPVFSGDYRQVEDWLDQAENSALGEQQDDEPTKASGPRLPKRAHGDARNGVGAAPLSTTTKAPAN